MRNPLSKRIFRELKQDIGKYLAIFVFMTFTIGFISGFLIAARNLKIEYDASFEKYNIEHGHFVLSEKPTDKLLQKIEEQGNITLYEDYYLDESADANKDGEKDSTIRIYKNRKELNLICLLEGNLPKDSNEIALERLFMIKNNLSIGNDIIIENQNFKISGIVAFPDYSTGYQDNNDMMFDSIKFCCGIVTDDGFGVFTENHLCHNYEWLYNDEIPKDVTKEREISTELSEDIYKLAFKNDNELDVFLPRYVNNSIIFAGEDMGSDKSMMEVLLYVLIAIMAFVFAVTSSHTIEKEAAVIGTLRASGYNKWEIYANYIAMPMIVVLFASIVGNVLGYTVFNDVAAELYLNSYNLTTYVNHFNLEALILTTIMPMVIMFVITSITLLKKLSFSPLNFLRRDLSKKHKTGKLKLPEFMGFFNRFRLRIIIQNAPNYFILLLGIVFANILLMFGLCMTPLIKDYGSKALEYKPCDYQYILKGKQEVDESIAEKFCVTSLKSVDDFYSPEDINVYGLIDNHKFYSDMKLPEEGVIITSDYATKYKIKVGDIINLKEPYGSHIYAFDVAGIYHYPSSLGVYMTQENFCKTFQEASEESDFSDFLEGLVNSMLDEEKYDYYNGYFSNVELEGTYLKEKNIASIITDDSLTKLTRQLNESMGEMFGLIKYFAIILFALLMYLLTKIIIEKNTTSISMVKILGYRNMEIVRLYLVSSVWVVCISSIIALTFNTWLFGYILVIFFKDYGGWFTLRISWELYLEMFLMMVGTYLAIAVLQYFKIRKIPMDEALKNVE